jgi:tetratricopeptide (TPR) repeat protein
LESDLQKNPGNVNDEFNISIALYYAGDYQESVEAFEKVQGRLPFRALWYQIEPIQSYYELGDYQKVFELTDQILNNGNRAFSELYIIRGIFVKRNIQAAESMRKLYYIMLI